MSNNDKIPLTREIIIDTAFEVWGNQNYKNTSLSSLSKELSITKQALYRHFKNKQDLFDSMEKQTLQMMEQSAEIFASLLKGKHIKEGLIVLAEHIIHKDRKYQKQVSFSTLMIRENRKKSKIYQAKVQNIIAKSAEALSLPPVALEFAIDLFFYFAVILEDLSFDEMSDFIINGFAKGIKTDTSEFKKIFKKAQSLDIGIHSEEEDKISRAIFETILKEGFDNVSLHSIALSAGMKKSSLYNYYDSKEDMLNQVMGKHISHTLSKHNGFVEAYNDIENLLFSHYAFMYKIFSFKPQAVDVLFEMFVSGEQILKYMEFGGMDKFFNRFFLEKLETILNGKIRDEVEGKLTMINLLFIYNIVVTTSIRMAIVLEDSEETVIENAGKMVKLFLEGISTFTKDDENYKMED